MFSVDRQKNKLHREIENQLLTGIAWFSYGDAEFPSSEQRAAYF